MISRVSRTFNAKAQSIKQILYDLNQQNIEHHKEKNKYTFEVQLNNTVYFIVVYDVDNMPDSSDLQAYMFKFVESFDDILELIRED